MRRPHQARNEWVSRHGHNKVRVETVELDCWPAGGWRLNGRPISAVAAAAAPSHTAPHSNSSAHLPTRLTAPLLASM